MGDEILKHIVKISLFILLFCSLAMANEAYKNSIKEYDKFFQEIGEKRVGVDEKIIDSVKNPFIIKKIEVVVKDSNGTRKIVKKDIYKLSAIFNNKAKINGKWYNIGDEIGNFKLKTIKTKSVVIADEHYKKELFIRKSNVSKIKFSSK